jgi:hypothetical protein
MPAWKRPARLDESLTSLTFTDVIFGLVFTQIFIRASALGGLSTALDVHLALSFAVAVGSYIGYRGSLKRGTYKLAFFNLPLLRFILDLFMIFLYYVLAVTPVETNKAPPLVHARADAFAILLIFAAYLAWDLVSKLMSTGDYKQVSFDGRRTLVTVGGLIIAAVVFGIASTTSHPLSQHLAIVVDSILIAMVIMYRWAKDCIATTPPAASTTTPPWATDLQAGMDVVRKAVEQLEKTIAAKK